MLKLGLQSSNRWINACTCTFYLKFENEYHPNPNPVCITISSKKSLENIEWHHIVHVHVRVFRTSTCECLMSFNVVNLLSDSYSINTVS
jgi:hypothetical protein